MRDLIALFVAVFAEEYLDWTALTRESVQTEATVARSQDCVPTSDLALVLLASLQII